MVELIYITGDIHRTDTERFERLREIATLTENDHLIILGDFGLLWDREETAEERALKQYFDSFGCDVLWVDGNHENFDRIDTLPIEEKYNGKVGVVSNRIFHLRRGEIYSIEGKTFFAFGGAESIDKRLRTEGLSWWSREMPSQAEYKRADENLNAHKNKVDYIITHDAPLGFYREVYNCVHPNELNKFLEARVLDKVSFIKWFFGHHHVDEKFDKLRAMYHDIEYI